MIGSQHRFHGHTSLSFVYRQGSTVRGQHLSLKFVRNQRRSTYRAAVIVSRKVNKSAVTRNRIRRRLYEIIRVQESAITEPYDIVLTVFSDQLTAMPAQELERLVIDVLTKAGITQPNAGASSVPHAIVKSQPKRL